MLGEYFHNYLPEVDAIYSSPLQRAHNTAKQVALHSGASITLDSRLVEFGIGDWEGLGFVELSQRHNYFHDMMSDEHHKAPNGESRAEVCARFVSAVEEIADKHQQQNVVVVAHGMAIGFALAHWAHNDTARWLDYRLANTSVSEVNLASKEVLYFNRAEHIQLATPQ
jgi:broad specificity phosphatase PhoE